MVVAGVARPPQLGDSTDRRDLRDFCASRGFPDDIIIASTRGALATGRVVEVLRLARAERRSAGHCSAPDSHPNKWDCESQGVNLFQSRRLLYERHIYEHRPTPLTVNALPSIAEQLMQKRDLAADKWPDQAGLNAVSQ